MKAVNKQVEEIKRLYGAINKTSSKHLKNDYTKNIKALKRDLKEYCSYKGYNYKEILKQACIY